MLHSFVLVSFFLILCEISFCVDPAGGMAAGISSRSKYTEYSDGWNYSSMDIVIDLLDNSSRFWLTSITATGFCRASEASPYADQIIHLYFWTEYSSTGESITATYTSPDHVINVTGWRTTSDINFSVEVDSEVTTTSVESSGSKWGFDYKKTTSSDSQPDVRSIFSCDLDSDDFDTCQAHVGIQFED